MRLWGGDSGHKRVFGRELEKTVKAVEARNNGMRATEPT
jgi:hypothetical protein